jgi:thiol:disulfide interchange protein DsbD
MEVTTFSDPLVIKRLASWKTIQVDVTDNNEQHQALAKEFGVFGPPTILFFDANGIENKQLRLVGNVSSEALLNHLNQEALR